MTKVDSLITWNFVDWIDISGAARGFDAFVSSCLNKRAKKLEGIVDNLANVDDPQCALGILRFWRGAPKMVYHLRCNSPSDNSKKILQKIESIQRATFEDILGVLKTRVGIGRSADQIQIAYVGSVFHSSVLVGKATGHNHLKTQSFVNAIEELSEIATTDPPQRNIQEELDNSAFDNLLGKQKSIKQKAPFQSLSAAVWCLVIFSPNPALRLHLSSIKLRVALK